MFAFFVLSAVFVGVQGGEHILRLHDGVHAPTTLVGVEEGSSILLRCEHPNGKIEALRWLHGGTAINSEYVKTKLDASYVEIQSYNIQKDDGVYECSAKGMSASYRLRGDKKHILPEGFRYCFGEELASCDHADFCQVEISTKIPSCVCESGWMGASCDTLDSVRSHSIISQPVCNYWPPVVTFLGFAFLLFLLAYGIYKFKVRDPHHYSKHFSSVVNNNGDKPPMVSGEYRTIKNGNVPVDERLNIV